MSRDPKLKYERNLQIKAAFAKLEGEQIHGVQKYRYEAILAILSKRFFLKPDTIAKIILAENEPDNQLNMFNDETIN